jgi:hypothetical protein
MHQGATCWRSRAGRTRELRRYPQLSRGRCEARLVRGVGIDARTTQSPAHREASPGGHVHRPAPIAMRPLRLEASQDVADRPRQLPTNSGRQRECGCARWVDVTQVDKLSHGCTRENSIAGGSSRRSATAIPSHRRSPSFRFDFKACAVVKHDGQVEGETCDNESMSISLHVWCDHYCMRVLRIRKRGVINV